MTCGADVIRRRNLIVANLIGAAIIAVALGGVGGVVWLLTG